MFDITNPRSRPWMAMLTAVILATTATAWADVTDDELEREKLVRIANELENVKAMVSDALHTAPTGQRVKFRYDWLIRDLDLLRQGVISHTDAPRQQRPVAPLRGDYRQ